MGQRDDKGQRLYGLRMPVAHNQHILLSSPAAPRLGLAATNTSIPLQDRRHPRGRQQLALADGAYTWCCAGGTGRALAHARRTAGCQHCERTRERLPNDPQPSTRGNQVVRSASDLPVVDFSPKCHLPEDSKPERELRRVVHCHQFIRVLHAIHASDKELFDEHRNPSHPAFF